MLRMWYNYDITLLQKGLFNKIISREKNENLYIQYDSPDILYDFTKLILWLYVVPQVSDVVHVPLDNIYNASVKNY